MIINESQSATPSAPAPAPGGGEQPAPAAPSEGGVPVETPAPEKTETEKRAEIEFGKRFAALSRRERAIIEREKLTASQIEKVQNYEKAQKAARENPLAFIEANGLTYQQLTDLVLNDGELSPSDQVKALQKRLDDEAAERLRKEQAHEQARIQQAVDNHKQSIRAHVETHAEAFELIQANSAFDLVYAVQDQFFAKTLNETGKGQILSLDAACSAVEEHLEIEAKKLLGLKKFQAKSNEANADTPTGATKTNSQAPRTLTNDATAGAPPPDQPLLSREESLARAKLKLRWT